MKRIIYTRSSIKSIKRMAEKDKINFDENYKNRIEILLNSVVPDNVNILFANHQKSENIGANSFFVNTIILYPRWAYEIAFRSSERLINAFKITIGHELTHKNGDIFCLKFGPKLFETIKWINEVHCDFAAAQKMNNCSRESLINSCEFKKLLKSKDKNTLSHPSWAKRAEYARNFDFDEKLILKIIDDTGIKLSDQEKEKIISDVFSKFERIYLSPQPEI